MWVHDEIPRDLRRFALNLLNQCELSLLTKPVRVRVIHGLYTSVVPHGSAQYYTQANNGGMSALMRSANAGDLWMMEQLVNAGAQAGHKHKNKLVGVHTTCAALVMGSSDGEPPNRPCQQNGATVLHYACRYRRDDEVVGLEEDEDIWSDRADLERRKQRHRLEDEKRKPVVQYLVNVLNPKGDKAVQEKELNARDKVGSSTTALPAPLSRHRPECSAALCCALLAR